MKTLVNDYLRAEVLPDAGASLVSLERKVHGEWKPLMRPTPSQAIEQSNAWEMASFILAPFSNVIPKGSFKFRGNTYQLKPNYNDDSAIHGDAYRHPWKTTEESTTYLVCQLDSRQVVDFNYPFPIVVEVHYSLLGEMLKVFLAVTNTGETPIPAGFGFHPFFNRNFDGNGSPVYLQLNAAGVYPDFNKPMQALTPELNLSDLSLLGKKDLNHCFGGWNGRAKMIYPEAKVELRMACDVIFSHVVVYNPPEASYFCVEPATHANNAFNLAEAGIAGTGMRVLTPGERMGGNIELMVLAS
jgi:aldose 1-epimerase